ncbi:hypothetical protein O9K51_09852 [Purpureocillium lavendulum]|uniref:Uncharacterized protein n=1 Tax=Purpureocillium lavendulum TaxID=1247861 RepID=A0AB34FFI0_9HYPO|nr:hypothetical protein O9K51_09852 [Purpureocillium lavendulum]
MEVPDVDIGPCPNQIRDHVQHGTTSEEQANQVSVTSFRSPMKRRSSTAIAEVDSRASVKQKFGDILSAQPAGVTQRRRTSNIGYCIHGRTVIKKCPQMQVMATVDGRL